MDTTSAVSLRIVPPLAHAPPSPAAVAAPARALPIAASIFVAGLAYAVVRYVVLGTVAIDHIPLFIANKATAFAGLTLIALTLALSPLSAWFPGRAARWALLRKGLGLAGFALGGLHALISVVVLSPAYLGKLYGAGGRLSFTGELVLLAGLVTLALLVPIAVTSVAGVKTTMAPEAWRSVQALAAPAFVVGGAHVAILGWQTWLTPATWPGGLPPITLLAAAVVVVTLTLRRLRRPSARRPA